MLKMCIVCNVCFHQKKYLLCRNMFFVAFVKIFIGNIRISVSSDAESCQDYVKRSHGDPKHAGLKKQICRLADCYLRQGVRNLHVLVRELAF